MKNKQSTEIVAYKNELNTVPMRNFNPKELDLFFAICSQMKNKNLSEITFTFEELRDLSNYKITSIDHFVRDLDSVYKKLLALNIRIGDNRNFVRFVLFTRYSISSDDQVVSIKTNDEFRYILNDLIGEFTKFELKEFTSISSSYSKHMYKFLKQFRTTGYRIFKINEFRELLCIPENYKMCNIDSRVLKPIKEELTPYFKKLKIEKIKAKKGRKIESIKFTFEAENDFKVGKKVFRDDSGHYYEKDILELTKEEVSKAFPEAFPK